MISLRKAQMSESKEILKFYKKLIFSIKDSEFKPKWNDSYPDLEFIENSISKGELYVYSEDDIIASVVVNNKFGEEYENIEWNVDAKPSETLVIHTFAVNSQGKGIGRKIFTQIERTALKNNIKTIRIDVIDGNVGAMNVFEKFGFEYVDSIEMFHNAVGLQTFHLYEKKLENG